MSIKYIIYAPDFAENSAGVRALYILADRLNKKGLRTYITGSHKTTTALDAPLIPMFLAQTYAKVFDFAAVYPETITGNPIGARRVVRWVLNKPGLLAGEQVYDPEELVFNYSAVYSPYIENPIAGMLYLPTIRKEIFNDDGVDPNLPRTLECFYIGKSTYKEGYFDRSKTFEITKTGPSKKDLGNLFRAAKVLYCFDNSSIIVFEAALCGCPAVIIPDGTQTRADYETLELGMNGIAWGIEELPRAQASVQLVAPAYATAEIEFEKQLDDFIDITSRGLENEFSTPRLDSLRRTGTTPGHEQCPDCVELRKELDLIYTELDAFQKSPYFIVRRRFGQRFPIVNKVITAAESALFFTSRFFKRLILDRSAKNKSERVVQERRALLKEQQSRP
jgi:hypothetical protein